MHAGQRGRRHAGIIMSSPLLMRNRRPLVMELIPHPVCSGFTRSVPLPLTIDLLRNCVLVGEHLELKPRLVLVRGPLKAWTSWLLMLPLVWVNWRMLQRQHQATLIALVWVDIA